MIKQIKKYMKQKKQIFKKNKEFNLVVDFFGGLTNAAKVLDGGNNSKSSF
jgi:hypothetical protein